MKMVQGREGKGTLQGKAPMAYLLFIAIAYVVTAVMLLILAFLLYRFQLSRKAVQGGVILIYIISTFIAGYLAGKKAGSRKYLWGFLMGAGYFLILFVMSLVMRSAEGGLNLVTTFLLCAGGGALGGMLS